MFEMKPEYYIGIKMIDEQHKQLFTYGMKHIADYEDFDIPYGMVSKSYFVC